MSDAPIVVVLEDQKVRGLQMFVLQSLIQEGARTERVRFQSAQGTGGFRADIARTAGHPIRGARPQCVICVADADCPSQLVDGFQGSLRTNGERRRFELAWRESLRSLVRKDLRSGIHALVIRWAQESLATTLPEMLLDWAAEQDASAVSRLRTAFEACTPTDPRTAADFLMYDRPDECLTGVVRAVLGENVRFNKAHHNDLFALRAIPHRDLLFKRHRDFARLHRLLRSALRN